VTCVEKYCPVDDTPVMGIIDLLKVRDNKKEKNYVQLPNVTGNSECSIGVNYSDMNQVYSNIVLHTFKQLLFVGVLLEESALNDRDLPNIFEATEIHNLIPKINEILYAFFQDETILDEFRVQV
jgi:hypothetical protein